MLKKRIIPCLDIKDGKVVKGVNFVDLELIGDPVELGKKYEQQGADEIVFLNIAGEENFDVLIKRASKEISIPITVGGGLRSMDDFRKTLAAGAAKVSVNSAAVFNPQLIFEASKEFGKQCIIAAIDAQKVGENYNVFVKGGSEDTGLELVKWAKKCEELGAGEILLTSIDADGTQDGYDIDMTKLVVESVRIPVIASGGCGKISDIVEVFAKTGCDAALAASLFHYGKATVNDIRKEL